MIDMVFTLMCFIAGYLLKLCHIGIQLKTSHPKPWPDLPFQIQPRLDLKNWCNPSCYTIVYSAVNCVCVCTA